MRLTTTFIVATTLCSLAAVAGANAVAQTSPTILDVGFTVQGQANSPDANDAFGGVFLSEPESGATLDAQAVLGLMQENQPTTSAATSHFGASTVFASITDATTGGTSLFPIADCENASFETVNGATFEQQMQCGNSRFSMSLAPEGIVIIADGEAYATIPLHPNAYIINGVPYIVR